MAERLAQVGDLWRDMHAHKQSLERPFEQLRGMLTAGDWDQAWAASTRKPAARKTARRKPA
jgi:hypothetical protein